MRIALLSTSDTDLLSARASGADYLLANPARPGHQSMAEMIEGADLLVARILGGPQDLCSGFRRIAATGLPTVVLGGEQQPNAELMELSSVPVGVAAEAHRYLAEGGPANLAQLHAFLGDTVLLTGEGFEAPQQIPAWGHPSWWESQVADDAGLPRVGILYYRAHEASGNTDFARTLAEAVEATGQAKAVPVYAGSLRQAGDDLYEALAELDALVATVLAAGGSTPASVAAGGDDEAWDVARMAALDIPVIQGLCLTTSRADWLASDDGVTPMDSATQIAIPEFDGRIIAGPFSFKEFDDDGLPRYVADEERCRRLAGLATNHARLRHVPNDQKKLALVLSAYPTKHARIGNAVGLDTPVSAIRLLDRLRTEGYDLGSDNAVTRILDDRDRAAEGDTRVGEERDPDNRVGEERDPDNRVGEERDPDNRVGEERDPDNRVGEERDPDSVAGDALIHALIAAGGQDEEWLTNAQLTDAHVRITAEQYREWTADLPQQLRDEMREAWGEGPGELFVNDAGELVLATIQAGNVVILIQPPRGFGENPVAIYHDPDMAPSHHYIGAYKWLEHGFGAHAVVHLGKHGSMEWLPGKTAALSSACGPDAAIGSMPLIYPFLVNDPGEGAQAKRRAHAVIVDHLVPPMARAESYGDIARLEQLMDEHANIAAMDPAKLPAIRAEIWSLMRAAEMHRDLGLDERPEDEEFDDFLLHVDGWLCEIKDAQIRDGLHTLGQAPTGEARVNLVLAILRAQQVWGGVSDAVPGLRRALGLAEDAELSQTDAIEAQARALVTAMEETDWNLDAVDEVVARVLDGAGADRAGAGSSEPGFAGAVLDEGVLVPRTSSSPETRCANPDSEDPAAVAEEVAGAPAEPGPGRSSAPAPNTTVDRAQVATVLRFAAEQVVPRLARTTDELDAVLHALEGGFISSGPSGSPLRGLVNVLPTGRNFYTVDPRAVPSRLAWETGQAMADSLIQRYLDETGEYPTSVGLSVWGTSAMRTSGDDIAEVLALIGVRPEWDEASRRVGRLEVVPLEELGRPRIDVTVRISGFFRDAFPHVVAMLDDAVAMVAELDEPLEQNHVRRHVVDDLASHGDERRARTRIFGSKPGSYGAGILQVVESGTWRSDEDLAEVYTAWGGFAYGRGLDGAPAADDMRTNYRRIKVAAKNIDSAEHDIIDSDDYYQYHGGMVATVRALTGAEPKAYVGDSTSPDRVRTRSLAEETTRIFRARVVNPRWIAAMRRHGYKGAFELAATVDYLFGFDATAGVVDDWMYDKVGREYVLDPQTQEFMRTSNPWALRGIVEKLHEAVERGLWAEPDPELLEQMQQVYLDVEGDLEDEQ